MDGVAPGWPGVSDVGRATPATPHTLAYRKDIDGLRAVAVLAVIGFHLQVSWLSGGFVGVDVFFVISGYLIGALILTEVKLEKFTLAGFYARRIRRIAPAFAAMVLSVLIASYFLLFPAEYVRLAWSAVFACLSVSNIYFAQHMGYFDAPASTQVLLHTWSLGVEEQFYLVFPLLVIAVNRYAPNRLNHIIALVWVVSFASSVFGVSLNPSATFYLAPARAWELLLGTLLARWQTYVALSRLTRNLVAFAGMAMIGFSIVEYNIDTPFPGLAALVPCLGTALVITAGCYGGSVVASALSLRPVVFIGLISYSLYLWHWPIIFFERSDSALLQNRSRVLIVLYSFAIATISWMLIEKPFRKSFNGVQHQKTVAVGVAALGLLAAGAGAIGMANGLPGRFSPAARAYAAYLDYGQAHFREGVCFIDPPYTFSDFNRDACLAKVPDRKNYLLIGDSHAAQLWYGLSTKLANVHILQATTAGCRPEFTQAARGVTPCSQMMNYMFSDYLINHHVDRLLIAARWVQRDVVGLGSVLAWAQGRSIPVTVFGPAIEYDSALPRILATAAQINDLKSADSHRSKNNDELDNQLRSLAAKYGATYISYYDLLCTSDHCVKTAEDGSPMEFDTDHLTKEGSQLVVRKLIESGKLN